MLSYRIGVLILACASVVAFADSSPFKREAVMDEEFAEELKRQQKNFASGAIKSDGIAEKSAERVRENTGIIDQWMRGHISQQNKAFVKGAEELTKSPPKLQMPKEMKTMVFISFSLPERYLRSLFAESLERPGEVVFVVRGWTPPNMAEVFQNTYRISKGLKDVPDIIIDPTLFREYEVDQVPMFITENKGKWNRIYGDLAIHAAERFVANGRVGAIEGKTYKIKEPDILEIMERRTAEYDWKKAQSEAMERAEKKEYRYEIRTANVSRKRTFDPSIRINRDIRDPHSGRVLARKGAILNPLDHMSYDKVIIVFDGDNKRHIELAKKWMKEAGRNTLLLTSNLAAKTPEGKSLSEIMGSEVFPLNDQLVKRLGIEVVPSRVAQEGRILLIEEKAL